MGGDEFLVFIPHGSEMDTKRFVRSFDRKLLELNRREDRSFQVSASVGAYFATLGEGASFEDCLHHSDKIMYRVKEKHRKARKALCQ